MKGEIENKYFSLVNPSKNIFPLTNPVAEWRHSGYFYSPIVLIEEREVEVTAERTISSDEWGLDRIQLKSLWVRFKSLLNLSLFIKHINISA